MAFTERKLIPAGIVSGRAYGTTGAICDLGDIVEGVLAKEYDEKALPNLRGGGGNAAKKKRLTSAILTLTFADLVAQVTAWAHDGTVTDVSAGSATAEAQTAQLGGVIPLNFIDPTTVVVQDVTDTTTYTAGTDYTLTYNGIEIPAASPTIVDDDVLHISYSYSAQKVIEALKGGNTAWYIHVDGTSDNAAADKWDADFWKWDPQPTDSQGILSEEFDTVAIEGELLSDSTKGASESSYYRFRQLA